MKLKSVIKIGLPILGMAVVSISLPLTLTSCSNNESNSQKQSIEFTNDLSPNTEVVKGQNFIQLKVDAKSQNDKQLGYQWFYKLPATDSEHANLTDSSEDKIHGFKKIEDNPTATTNTLKIAADLQKYNGLKVVCATYEIQQARDDESKDETTQFVYSFSKVTTISVNEEGQALTSVNSTPNNIKTLNISSSLTSLDGVLEENSNTVKSTNPFFTTTAQALGFTVQNTNEYPQIKSMELIPVDSQDNNAETRNFNLKVSLNDGYTWGVDVFKDGEGLNKSRDNSFKINDEQTLVIENLQSGIKTSYGNLVTYLKYFANRSNADDLSATIQQIQAGLKGKTYSASNDLTNFNKLVTGLGYTQEQVASVGVKLFNTKDWKLVDGWSFPIQFTFNFNSKQFDSEINYEGQYVGTFGPIKYKVNANDNKLILDIQNYLTVKVNIEEKNDSTTPDNTLSLKSVKNFISTIQSASGSANAETYTLENNDGNAVKINALAEQLKVPSSVIGKIEFKVTNNSGHTNIQPIIYFTEGVLMDFMSVQFKQNGTTGNVIAKAGYTIDRKIATLTFTPIEASSVTVS